ncbi:MAG: ACP phosphodiesterase [Bacteroidota bacterium]
MNYLAHLHLSGENDELMLGNFLADSVRPKEIEHWTAEMKRGYDLHIEIDSYTDRHPAFKRAVSQLRPHHRKYAPVVLDILNDHLLARFWTDYHHMTFSFWEERVYDRLGPFENYELPPKAEKLLFSLLKYEYLHVYLTQEGLRGVLSRMDKRARFASSFVRGVEHLYEAERLFVDCFHRLYIDLSDRFG